MAERRKSGSHGTARRRPPQHGDRATGKTRASASHYHGKRRCTKKACVSKRVRRILHLEGMAARYRAHYESALARVAPRRHKAEELRQAAVAIKVKLSPHELHELRRIRSGV